MKQSLSENLPEDTISQEMLFADDAESTGATAVDLEVVTKLSRKLLLAQREVDRLEEELKAAKTAKRQIEEVEIPEAMGDLTKVELRGGFSVQLEHVVSVRDTPEFQAWAVENGFGSLIKVEVTESFDRSEYEKAIALMEELQEKGYDNVQTRSTIHNATLRAQVKRFLESGEDFPREACKFHEIYRAKIKGPQ